MLFYILSTRSNLEYCRTHIHTHINGPLSRTTRVSWYQKGKTNLDFTEARDSEWQWHQLGHMQVCTSLQTDNHASTPPLSFLQAGCPFCCPTNSVKALKAQLWNKGNKRSDIVSFLYVIFLHVVACAICCIFCLYLHIIVAVDHRCRPSRSVRCFRIR